MESKKRLARDVVNTFATHASFDYDITNTVCWAQNGSIHGHIFLQLSNVDFYQAQWGIEHVLFYFYIILTEMIHETSSVWFPFKPV